MRLLLGLLLTVASLYFALQRVDLTAVRHTLAAVRPWPVIQGMLSVVAALVIRVARWQLLLDAGHPEPLKARPARRWIPTAASLLASHVVNAIYPLRLGEIGRVAVVGAATRDYAFVAGTLALEKALDLLAFFGLILLFLLIAPLSPASGASAGLDPLSEVLPPSWLILILVLALLAAPAVVLLARRVQTHWLPERLKPHAERLLAGMTVLRRPRVLAAALLLTLLSWVATLLPNYYTLLALDLDLPLDAPLLVLLFLQVGISAPSLPAKVGIFEYACQLALSFYALSPETGLSYGILLHGVVYLPVIACGVPAIWLASLTPTPPAGESALLEEM